MGGFGLGASEEDDGIVIRFTAVMGWLVVESFGGEEGGGTAAGRAKDQNRVNVFETIDEIAMSLSRFLLALDKDGDPQLTTGLLKLLLVFR